MTKSIGERELVLGILLDVTKDGAYSHIALRNVLSKYQYLDKKERAFITRLAEGTLEHMLELDYIINQFSKVKVNKMKPVIRNIIRSAVYQLKYMDHVPNSAVVNEAVKLAVKKGFTGLKGFVNGLLRNIDRNMESIVYPKEGELEYYSIKYSMPIWILQLWQQTYDISTIEIMLKAFLADSDTVIRCNLNQISMEELLEELKMEGVTAKQHAALPYALTISGYDYLEGLASFQKGHFQVQDLSSMFVAESANVMKNDYIIDVCAAPGGKAVHFAEKLEGTGHVEARDLTEYKVSLIESNIERLGLKNIHAVQCDACVLDTDSVEKADVVIADLPCSGLGVLGKKTDLKYKMTRQMQLELVLLQQNILSVVNQYVKPGGKLVYSTCTIHEAENYENVQWFLQHFPQFSLVEEPRQMLPGIDKSDGFFIAVFRKDNCG